MRRAHQYKKGFAALISVILISAILMLVAASMSFSGFYARYNVLDSELKAQSEYLAESCTDLAHAKLIGNPAYNPSNEMVFVGPGNCTIENILASSSQKIITARSTYKNYRTILKTTLDADSLTILSKEEI